MFVRPTRNVIFAALGVATVSVPVRRLAWPPSSPEQPAARTVASDERSESERGVTWPGG